MGSRAAPLNPVVGAVLFSLGRRAGLESSISITSALYQQKQGLCLQALCSVVWPAKKFFGAPLRFVPGNGVVSNYKSEILRVLCTFCFEDDLLTFLNPDLKNE